MIRLFFLAGLIAIMQGCKIYSFSGANVPPDVKTVQIDLFHNRAGNGPALLSQTFTDRLKNKFILEANLKQASFNGDLHLKGYISEFVYANQAPTAGVSSSLTRLSISVYVEFQNNKDEKDKWQRTFTSFAEVPATEDLFTVENRMIDEIIRQLVDNIFLEALVKW